MRVLYILLSVLLVAWLGCATPIDPKHRLVNRPAVPSYLRARRSPQGVKGQSPIKGRVPLTRLELNVRKGEYVCGNRICKLEPGKIPQGCNGMCQYPL